MKLAPFFVGASLAINAVLLTVLVRNAFVGNAKSESIVSPTRAVPAVSVATAPVKGSEAWAELQAGDLKAQVERLRADGFPPATIRAIMSAQLRAKFAARRKALDAAVAALPYWESAPNPKLDAERRALAREEHKALEALLGPDPENGYAARLHHSFPDLSAEKVAQMAEISERYDDQRNETYRDMRGSALPDDGKKLEALEKARHAELAAVLTPQELEDYDLRESRTANQLRYTLSAFDATEQEYRTLFKLQSDFDAQYGQMQPGMDQEQARARREAQTQLTEQIKAALGADRYAEYQRSTDFNYRRTTQLVARLNLPPETANEIYAVQQSTQQSVTELRRGNVPNAERATQMAALAAEAEARISAKLGPVGFEVYKANSNWLTNLSPPRPAPPPPKP